MNKTDNILNNLNDLEKIITNLLKKEEQIRIKSTILTSQLYSLGKIEGMAVCLQKIKELQIKQIKEGNIK